MGEMNCKKCSVCGKVKPLIEFIDKRLCCKECYRKKKREYYKSRKWLEDYRWKKNKPRTKNKRGIGMRTYTNCIDCGKRLSEYQQKAGIARCDECWFKSIGREPQIEKDDINFERLKEFIDFFDTGGSYEKEFEKMEGELYSRTG